MKASAIVCTYNRARSLEQTMKCLAAQQVDEGIDWELIVANSNSTDNTADVVGSFSNRYARCRYEFEAQQGLSYARNRGISFARGDFLLFTDDDVCPEPDWIQTTLDGMGETGCDACGGSIAPVWESPPPSWLTDRFLGFLAIRVSEAETQQIADAAMVPYGANMAFRKSIFDHIGLFDTSKGRKGDVLASGEGGELFDRILQHGMPVMFFPHSIVHHRIEAFRLPKSYFRRWRYQTSQNIAVSCSFPGKLRFLRTPLYFFPQLMRVLWTAFKAHIQDSSDEAFFREITIPERRSPARGTRDQYLGSGERPHRCHRGTAAQLHVGTWSVAAALV